MSATEWREKTYDQSFASALASLRKRKAEDPGFSPESVRAILAHLYVQDGNDWGGRGELQDLQLQSTIAAHEAFVAEWEREKIQERSEDEPDPYRNDTER